MSALCFSLEGIGFLCSALATDKESIRQADAQFERLLRQVESSVEKNPKLLRPSEKAFKKHNKNYRHYFVLKDSSSTITKRPKMHLERWQKALYELLCEVDLEQYQSVHSSSEDEDISKFLTKLKQVPAFFFVEPSKAIQIKLLVELVMNSVKEGCRISAKEIGELSTLCREAAAKFKLANDSVHEQLKRTIKEVIENTKRVSEMRDKLKTEVLPLLISEGILCRINDFPFTIQKGEPERLNAQPEEAKSPKPSTFVLSVNQGKGGVKKLALSSDAVPESRKGKVLFKGYSIQHFIEVYGAIPNVSKLVAKKDNSCKLLELYKDFLTFIEHVVNNEMKLPIGSAEQRGRVMACIERYILRMLYPRYSIS